MLRIIAGSAKGRRLKTPPGLNTRPVTDRIRESLFSIWGNRMADAAFLDLFAGSGSMGIEALSRGACKSVFVENDSRAVQIIKDNLEHCGFAERSEVYRADAIMSIKKFYQNHRLFDIIYIDPPFTRPELFDLVMGELDECPILEPTGTMVIRGQRKMLLPDNTTFLKKIRHDHYGESEVHHYSTR